MELTPDSLTSLAVALGLGLLIGVERERRKGDGPTRHFAGLRTFTLAALAGAVAQLLAQPLLTFVAGALVASLAAVSHLRDRSRDPGATTEVALFLTYLLGVLAVALPALAAAGGVLVAALLAAREPLQRFTTVTLSEQEYRDALLLAGSTLIVLPLAPSLPLPWLGGLNPHRVWLLVVLIMGVQSLGHIALRAFGPRLGLPLSGLAAGFVSSTATVAAMGTRTREQPELYRACVAGAWWSTVATSLQLALVAWMLHPPLLQALWPTLAGAFLSALALGALATWWSKAPTQAPNADSRAFSLWQSLGLAALLSALTVIVGWAQAAYGSGALYGATALAGLADVHSAAAAAISVLAQGQSDVATVSLAVLLAFLSNTVSKIVVAFVAGGLRYGWVVSLGLVGVGAAACLPWVLSLPQG
ncbi:MAG: hypothetical protein RLZ81_1774 [Pseudomonadota bacterium]|jgi:uncharacterized membrane protein (DUF4010 family)